MMTRTAATPANLIRDLEDLECQATKAFTLAVQKSDPRARVLDIAGGHAFLSSPDSMMNSVKGVGSGTPVKPSDLDDITAFFRAHGATQPVTFDVCPHADDSLVAEVARRAWPLAGFEQVLWRTVTAADRTLAIDVPPITIAPADRARAREYSRTVAQGFTGLEDPPDWHIAFGLRTFEVEAATPWSASADSRIVAGASIFIFGNAASLAGASVLPEFRGRGIQGALLAARLSQAVREGCTLAKIDTKPGTISQRNAERFGFHVAYTRAQFMMPVA